jgi:hypothetical protein
MSSCTESYSKERTTTMSGGSFEYLYLKDVSDLIKRVELIEEMAQALEDAGAPDAANETREFLRAMQDAVEKLQAWKDRRLAGIWHDMEWMVSGDYSAASLDKGLAEYRNERESQ